MNREIYVSVPVRDIDRSREFFSEVGFGFHSSYSDENVACMVVAEGSYVMHMDEDAFRAFSLKEPTNTGGSAEVIVALSAESREEVDMLVEKAVHAGGTEPRGPQDHGWMYGRAFEDLDGHLWEVFHISGEPAEDVKDFMPY